MVDTLEVIFRTVTQAFVGGADPDDHAETRAASLKGLIRFWYRTLDPAYRVNEPRYFGSTDGKSPCVLRLIDSVEQRQGWDANRYRQRIPNGFQRGRQDGWINGIAYLGYPLKLWPNDRKALAAGTTFTVRCTFRPGQATPAARRAWLAGIWLLGHLGGFGARARRGLGSIEIVAWQGWAECEELPLGSEATTPQDWLKDLRTGLAALRAWYPDRPAPDHPVLDAPAAGYLLRKAHGTWEQALDEAGARLQGFRRARELDRTRVRAHLSARSGQSVPGITPALLTSAPDRAAFGLPHTVRLVPGRDSPTVTFSGSDEDHDRQASPIWIRVVRIGTNYHGLFFHLPAPFLSTDADGNPELVAEKEPGKSQIKSTLAPPGPGILTAFLNEVGRHAHPVWRP